MEQVDGKHECRMLQSQQAIGSPPKTISGTEVKCRTGKHDCHFCLVTPARMTEAGLDFASLLGGDIAATDSSRRGGEQVRRATAHAERDRTDAAWSQLTRRPGALPVGRAGGRHEKPVRYSPCGV